MLSCWKSVRFTPESRHAVRRRKESAMCHKQTLLAEKMISISPVAAVYSLPYLLTQDRWVQSPSRGHWVVKESCGQFGGVFFNRAEAVKCALFDGVDHRPRAVILVPGVLELETMRGRKVAAEQVSATSGAKLRRVA